ncbi:hypothetical protein IP91_04774 [Pseudoduganella lurida]|uniref:Uncharacterized protein n=1 Tax=Pseudoduganella lurida TaxID=1036180 RepID=A0A562QWN9_9BURK|nr:hypothetical protein [Pseudoduganella lurida]TWI61187.1 hypothetical protein IP91_04774 [Pseudoduganella lurida]
MTITSSGAEARPADAECNAWNAAFHELGLSWFWDAAHLPGGGAGAERSCVREYLTRHQPHLLAAYDADFLVDAILAAKARCAAQMAAAGNPGAAIDWRELQQRQIGA